MARINAGVNPYYISDQHLNAEYVEIQMIMGTYKVQGFKIKSIPERYTLGRGHINFFRNKLWYLNKRLTELYIEMSNRGFRVRVPLIDFDNVPFELINDWQPSLEDSLIVRERIKDRLHNPLKAKPGFHKYYKNEIQDIRFFADEIIQSNLYYV